MRVGRVSLGAILVLGGLRAGALPVHVTVDWPSGVPASAHTRVSIRAVRAAGAANSSVPVEAETGPDGAVLDLTEGVWQVQASAPGYWGQETTATVARQAPASVRLGLWPAASLHGEIQAAEGESLPDSLEVRLIAIPARAGESATPQAQPGPSRAELHCRVDKEAWSCLGPAGLFDAELEATGYAPRYVWGVTLKAAESTDLGRTGLRRAASVFGRAVRNDGSDPPGPCRAILEADVERRHGPEPDPDAGPQGEASFSALLSQRGYFQFVGVLPGRHLLNIECQAASGFRELIVQPDGETRIDPPVTLEENTLEIAVTPQTDPAGRPWQLSVNMTSPPPRQIADKAATSADGRWIRRGLLAGNYRVTVNSSDGAPWLQRYFDLGAGSGPLSLRLASVKVAGRAMLGADPVRARLVFSNDATGARATLNSDADGRFQGLLPIPANAKETSWNVEARAGKPPVDRRLMDIGVPTVTGEARAWLDLALPLLAVRGSVVAENGQPQRGTQVTFEDPSGTKTTTATDDEGGFEMSYLAPGKYTALAESDEGASDVTPFEALDGSEKELRLTIHPSMHIPFYVESSSGPVDNATVQVWIAPGVPQAFGRTDRNGRFEVKLPPGTTEVGLTVGASDYALKLTRMPVSSGSDPSQNANNTITLGTAGGKLELNFEPSESALDRSAVLYLVHNGAVQDARTVAGWGTGQAGTSGDGPAEVESIEPGDYALCVLQDASQAATLWEGAVPQEICRTGTVVAGQTLTLSPVSPQ